MAYQQATDIELGWLAGIIDGEAWLGFVVSNIRSRAKGSTEIVIKVKPEMRIVNCDPAIIDRAVDILQKIGINPYRRSRKPGNIRRVIHQCSCHHMVGVQKILLAIHEHLTGNKQERAKLILEFIALRQENPGIRNPRLSAGVKGWIGPAVLRPYTEEEMALVTACRALQNPGASEITRATREQALQSVANYAASEWAAHAADLRPEKI